MTVQRNTQERLERRLRKRTMSDGIIRTNDGVVLKDALRKSERRQKIRAISLVAPLGIFLLCVFIVPIALMLFRSVDNSITATALSETSVALADWESGSIPDEDALSVVASELAALRATGSLGKITQRVNRFYPGMDSSLKRAAKEVRRRGGNDFKTMDKLVESAYDYADLSNRLWQLRSEHSRLSHTSRIFDAQSKALKAADEFPNQAAFANDPEAQSYLAFMTEALAIPEFDKIDRQQADRLIAQAQNGASHFPDLIGSLETELAAKDTELKALEAVLGGANTAAGALAARQSDQDQSQKKSITETQAQEYRVNVAQRQFGKIRARIQAHKDVLKTIDALPDHISALDDAQLRFDGSIEASRDILAAKKVLSKSLSLMSQKGSLTELKEAEPLVQAGKNWIDMRGMRPLSETELKQRAFKLFHAYPYIENSKYDSFQALFEKAKKKTFTDPGAWAVLQRFSKPYVADYFLRALDLRYDQDGSIVREPPERRVFVRLLIWTIQLSTMVAVGCLLLGYPLAYLLATVPTRTSNMLMIFVLLPFWTSLLVRTTAWLSILSREGVINNTWVWLQQTWIARTLFGDFEPWRFELAFTGTATLIAMIHILLPFMILPVFSVMKNISPSYMRAGRSLGATGFTAFRRVYFPQTLPGIGAGALLVFILSIGYFITPALVGGEDGVLISNMIQTAMKTNNNPQLAAASGSILLVLVLILYWLYNKIVGVDSIKFG